MGTNYYITIEKDCPTCGIGKSIEEIHIGKSSGGWCFSLHVIPERNIHNLEDWKKFWRGKTITDEYDRVIPEEEMLDIITNRYWTKDTGNPLGYNSWSEFHEMNHSVLGPNNLLRHKLGNHCVGHGEGTWDYIPGEFS